MAVVPGEGLAQAIVHADIEIEQDEHRRLQALGEIEGLGAQLEALVGILGKKQHVLGVAVRGVGAGEQVGLLGARGHAGGRAAALHVEDHRGDLGEVGQAEEFLHQGDARAGGGGEGARAVPAGADHHADRGQFVLGLDDGVAGCAVVRIGAVLAAISGEGFDHRGRGRDRIPGRHRGAAIDRAQAGGAVAVDEDALADHVGAFHLQSDRAGQVAPGVVPAQLQGLDVGGDQLVLAAVLLVDQLFHLGKVDV
ncbi:hypothetical protein GALL_385050 [mine drainage metagenome]|uniref:Uncharacterized protein n=1 Tax=mine drainage metagenome TaxID=410659 RepID=A0A1J5Q7R2_9ZZZZ